MAKEIIWSSRAIASFDRIIKYLEKEWTKKEIEKLISNTKKVLQQIESESIKFRSSGKKITYTVQPSVKHSWTQAMGQFMSRYFARGIERACALHRRTK